MAKPNVERWNVGDKGTGWIPDIPDHRDQLFRDFRPRVAITERVALKDEFLPPIRDQLALGSCVGHSVSSALLYSLRQKGEVFRKPGYGLSPLYCYYRAREYINTIHEDSGAYIRDGVKGAFAYGVATEATHPYKIDRFTKAPTQTANTTARWHQIKGGYKRCLSVDEVMQALSEDMAVAGGFSCFSNLDAGHKGHIPMPGPNDSLEGGHAVFFVAADPATREFKFANSWNETWGDGGYGYLPFAFFEKGWADDFWSITHE